jgi:glycine dehydrogenase subunit 1
MFQPNSSLDEKKLLDAIGVASFDELVTRLPKKYLNPGLGLPPEASEMALSQAITDLSNKNSTPLSFLGAGAYDHFISSIVPAISSRGEFATAYTPYQPEASQGTLQTIFEFQSIVAELFGLDIANASLYDGATALVDRAVRS